ncbi:hypothetical protein M3686_04770 [Micrococcus luteus]|uniref:hypothetical protein n=1 Tax=Micrococcus luteus TaxID=1270 RepID=UPI0020407D0B|nr:hypothetical protein [Micrococcus luteus]MCM3577447.1 hypothetical protein [Micrococcus luteus]
MLGFGAATAEVVELLTAAGVSASDDPSALELPGVWVTPGQPSISFEYLDGDRYIGRWDLYLISPDLKVPEALDHLSELLDRIRTALRGAVTEATAVTIPLPNHAADNLPALLITIDQEVTP